MYKRLVTATRWKLDEPGLPTGYRIMGDGIVYDKVWDETAEEIVSYSSSGDDSDIFEDCE